MPRGTVHKRCRVTSTTAPDKQYLVTLFTDAKPWCECGAQRFQVAKRPCKHIRAMVLSIAVVDGLTAVPVPARFAGIVDARLIGDDRSGNIVEQAAGALGVEALTVPGDLLGGADEAFMLDMEGI